MCPSQILKDPIGTAFKTNASSFRLDSFSPLRFELLEKKVQSIDSNAIPPLKSEEEEKEEPKTTFTVQDMGRTGWYEL